MTLSSFAAYIKQLWRNKPDTSTPVTAERLAHMEEGIKGNSDAIEEIAAAVVSQIINDPDKIASMAALYAVNQKVSALDGKVGDTAQLPDGATDVVTAIAKQNSDLSRKVTGDCVIKSLDNAGPVSNGKNVHIKTNYKEQTFFVIGLSPNSNINGHCSNIGITNGNIFEANIVDSKINPSYANGIIKLTNRVDWEYFIVLSSGDFSLYLS